MKEPLPRIDDAHEPVLARRKSRKHAVEEPAILTPRKSQLLLNALLREYTGVIVTGFILDAHIQNCCLVGRVYKSPSHANGERVIVEIREVVDFGVYYLVHSGRHDSFVIAHFHPRGGRRAMRHMLAMFEGAAQLGSKFTCH